MALYRTYRPQHFQDLFGQESVATILQQTLIQKRLSHAYLFSGPRGTGKTSTARIFARALSCLDPKQSSKGGYEPCDACESCSLITSGHTSDLIEIDAASNRGIEDIRELRHSVSYPPMQLRHKIYVIDEVHMLTTEAFNALLKTLEEPPPYCVFILATTEYQKVPLTIRSRCQLIRFERGSMPSIEQKLAAIVKAEHMTVPKEVISLIAKHSDGGFRDAETLLETLASRHSSLTLETVQATLGILSETQVTNLLKASFAGNSEETAALLSEYCGAMNGSLERLTLQLISALRDMLFTPDKRKEGRNYGFAAYALEQMLEAYIFQKSSPVPALPLEIALLNISERSKNGAEIRSDKERSLPSLAPVMTAKPIAVSVAKNEDEGSAVPVIELREEYIRDIRKAWRLMIERIAKENPVLSQAIKNCVFHTAENSVITIHVRYKFHADKMNEKKTGGLIKVALKELTDQEWSIEYIINPDLPRRVANKELTAGPEDVRAIFGS